MAPSHVGKKGAPGASCLKCPSVVEPKDQARLIGGVVGSPMCGRFMKILTRPAQPADVALHVMKDVASKCDAFGVPATTAPIAADSSAMFEVGIDTDAKHPSGTAGFDNTTPTCRGCANFVPTNKVQEELGWSQPACRAKGALMIESHLVPNAKNCGTFVAQVGVRTYSNFRDTFKLLPIFSDKYGVVDVAQRYMDAVSLHADRSKYDSDKEVGPKAKANGIRAWRQIDDPLGYGEPVYLPIFDPDAKVNVNGEMRPLFTEHELEIIPQTGDSEHPELYADHGGLLYSLAVLLMRLDETPAMWGQGGTGKTEMARYIAWLCGLPFHRISINGSSEIDDLAGKYIFVQNETRIHFGRLATAWQRPGIIALDEPNTGPNDIWQMCRSLTDSSRMFVLDHLDGTRVSRHDYCMFMMLMNPSWDIRNAGTHDVSDADLSRLAHIMFDYPPRDLEKAIIRKRIELDGWTIPEDKLDSIMNVAADLRAASANGALQVTWGVRHNIKAARNIRYFPGTRAYRMAIGDALEPAQLETLIRFVTAQFGD
jgi:MoxR-like ATPase